MKDNGQISSLEDQRNGLIRKLNFLEKKKGGFLKRLFDIRTQAEKEKDEREHKTEIESLQSSIDVVEQEIFQLGISAAREKIRELEKEAIQLQDRRRSLFAELEKIDERFFDLCKLAEETVPKRRIQVSSKKFVVMTRTIKLKKLMWNPFGKPGIEYEDKIEESIVPAIPENVKNHIEEYGFTLKAGEELIPEELTPDNSKDVPIFSLPGIFSGFEAIARPFSF